MFETLMSSIKKEEFVLSDYETYNDYDLIAAAIRVNGTKTDNNYNYTLTNVNMTKDLRHGWLYNNELVHTGGDGKFDTYAFSETTGVSRVSTAVPWTNETNEIHYLTRPYQFGKYAVLMGSRTQTFVQLIDLEAKTAQNYPNLPVSQASPLIVGQTLYVFGGFNWTESKVNRTTIYSRQVDDFESPWATTETPVQSAIGFNADFFLIDGLYYGVPGFTPNNENYYDYTGNSNRMMHGLFVFNPRTMSLTSHELIVSMPYSPSYGSASYFENGKIYHQNGNNLVEINLNTMSTSTSSKSYTIAMGHKQAKYYTPKIALTFGISISHIHCLA